MSFSLQNYQPVEEHDFWILEQDLFHSYQTRCLLCQAVHYGPLPRRDAIDKATSHYARNHRTYEDTKELPDGQASTTKV